MSASRVHRRMHLLVALTAIVPAATPARAQEPCAVREVERWLARLDDGSHVYVESTDLVAREGHALLAGTPTYVVAPGEVGIDAARVVNGVAGVMLEADRSVRVVPWPLESGHLRVLRVAAAADGWQLLLGEMDVPVQMPDSGSLVGLWYGRWDGVRWSEVQAVPLPPREGLRLNNSSSLVPIDRGFAWALPYRMDEARGAVVLFREGAAWRWETIDARHGSYVELWDAGDELNAALVTTDPAARRDSNSLFLFRRSPEWRMDRLLFRGLSRPVHDPRAVRSKDGVVLTWRSFIAPEWHMLALLDASADSTQVQPIDPAMSFVDTFADAGGRVVWVTEHVAPDDGRTLRFAMAVAGRVRSLGEVASPYVGHFAAAGASAGDVLVAGPRFSRDPADVPLVTLVLRFTFDCDDG